MAISVTFYTLLVTQKDFRHHPKEVVIKESFDGIEQHKKEASMYSLVRLIPSARLCLSFPYTCFISIFWVLHIFWHYLLPNNRLKFMLIRLIILFDYVYFLDRHVPT